MNSCAMRRSRLSGVAPAISRSPGIARRSPAVVDRSGSSHGRWRRPSGDERPRRTGRGRRERRGRTRRTSRSSGRQRRAEHGEEPVHRPAPRHEPARLRAGSLGGRDDRVHAGRQEHAEQQADREQQQEHHDDARPLRPRQRGVGELLGDQRRTAPVITIEHGGHRGQRRRAQRRTTPEQRAPTAVAMSSVNSDTDSDSVGKPEQQREALDHRDLDEHEPESERREVDEEAPPAAHGGAAPDGGSRRTGATAGLPATTAAMPSRTSSRRSPMAISESSKLRSQSVSTSRNGVKCQKNGRSSSIAEMSNA